MMMRALLRLGVTCLLIACGTSSPSTGDDGHAGRAADGGSATAGTGNAGISGGTAGSSGTTAGPGTSGTGAPFECDMPGCIELCEGGACSCECAPLDAGSDAADRQHVCYVHDDCNGGTNNDYSANGCPMFAPDPGSSCSLTAGQACFYCDPGVEARHWWETIPLYTCEQGTWSVESVGYACE